MAADYVGNRDAYAGTLARAALVVAGGSAGPGGLAMVRSGKVMGRIRKLGRGIRATMPSRRRGAGMGIVGLIFLVKGCTVKGFMDGFFLIGDGLC